jgi:hypothetical protein
MSESVFRSVPFVFLFKKGTPAELSVSGVRSVPHMYICGKRNTLIIGTGTPNE